MAQVLSLAFVGSAVVLLIAVLIVRESGRRSTARWELERERLRRDTLTQLAADDREHARALLKSARELFGAGHTATAAILEMQATDYEMRADDHEAARSDPTLPMFPARQRQLSL
ncbi:hypothetical protein REH65_27755 [Saccharopolyspora sp. ID03-671]|uniref:hypothetical protein n=1 Tax=Saccharopolyspora sp. ID03-671 TaxID=3073066 RepID=UPI00324D058A